MSLSESNAKSDYNVYGIDIALEPPKNQEETNKSENNSKHQIEQSPRESGNKKIRKRYCKYCGSLINNTTKQCTGCGKQYFKSISFKKILIAIIIISLFALNIVQYNNTLSLRAEVSSLEKELKRIKKYTPEFYMDEDGKAIQIY